MTYITNDADAIKADYLRALKASGRPPAVFYTTNGKRMVHRSLLNKYGTVSPLSERWRDPRGPGNSSLSTVYINGLNGLGDAVQDILDRMSEDMKKELIKTAAINTAITISLNAIPIVGNAMSLVYAGVQALIGTRYQRETEELISDFQTEMKAKQASYQAKIDAAANQAMREEAPAAEQLALSNLPLNGLGMGDIWSDAKDVIMRPVKEAQRIVKQVVGTPVYNTVQKVVGKPAEQLANKAVDAAFDARDTLTGRSAKEDVEKAIDQARGKAISQMEAATSKAIADINSAPYRQQLRINMAKQIRQDPSVQALLSRLPAGTPQVSTPGMSVNEPSKAISFIPMAGAAAAVLAFGMFKS